MSVIDSHSIASKWLSAFSSALTTGLDVTPFFVNDGWLRDALTLSWNNRSLHGHQAIADYVSSNRDRATSLNLDSFALDAQLPPVFGTVVPPPNEQQGIIFGFRFSSPAIWGRGLARLLPEEKAHGDGVGTTEWKALTAYISAQDLVGYEESRPEAGTYDGHTMSWKDVKDARMREAEAEPDVVIVGAGQCGLMMAACLKQMRKRTLIVERSQRVGDSWRNRYPTCSLHTVRSASPFLYQPYPETFPIYPSKDKVADFMETYALLQELVVWTSSTLLPGARYDPINLTWEIYVDHAGSLTRLNPKHLIFATGIAEKPKIPAIPDRQQFKGPIIHSNSYKGGAAFSGKNVIVVGAGNSAADICQDLYTYVGSTGSVTMVQRSSTCVVTRESLAKKGLRAWPEGADPHLCSFKSASLPFYLLKQWEIDRAKDAWEEGECLYEGLRKVGFHLTLGEQNEGQFVLAYEKLGGFWVDVGCAELVASRKVQLKQSEIVRFTPEGLLFKDGSHLPADVVIFATGYEAGRDSLSQYIPPDIMSHVSAVGGMDSEGEINGCWRPSGYPHLWFAMGSFSQATIATKRLAILIQASDLGLLNLKEKPTLVNGVKHKQASY